MFNTLKSTLRHALIANIFIFSLILSLSAKQKEEAYAYEISTSSIEVFLKEGEEYKGEISFKNTEDSEIRIKTSTTHYNPESEDQNIETFITLIGEEVLNIAPGDIISIKYLIKIPEGSKPGTYDEVIFSEILAVDQTESVGVQPALGNLITINVVTEGGNRNSYTDDFLENSLITTEIIEDGFFPWSKNVVKVTYHNTTSYSYSPSGEIRSFISEPLEIVNMKRLPSSDDNSRVKPSESISEIITISGLSFYDSLAGTKVITEIYIQESDQFITDELIVTEAIDKRLILLVTSITLICLLAITGMYYKKNSK